jgi:hypothetical protein
MDSHLQYFNSYTLKIKKKSIKAGYKEPAFHKTN